MRMRAGIGIAAILAVACSSSGPAGSGGSFHYSGTHTLTIDDGSGPTSISCPASITTNAETGAFSGSITFDPCAPFIEQAFTTPITGSISGSTLTFTFPGLDSIVDEIESAISCTVTRVDTMFTGTLVGGHIQATFTADFSCEDGTAGSFIWAMDMQKGS